MFTNLSRQSQRAALVTLTACLLVGTCGAVQANTSATDATSATVSYRDLDLATDQGSRALYERINAAARRVCAVEDIRDLTAVASARECQQAAVSRAVHEVHNARLAVLDAKAATRG